MGSFALLNPVIYVDATDVTANVKKVSLHPTVDELDSTTFGAGAKGRLGGLRTVDFSAEGFMDNTVGLDSELWGNLGLNNNPYSACSEGAETKTSWMWLGGQAQYDQFGPVGDVAPFVISGKGTSAQGLVRGQLGKLKGVVSATGQLGSILTIAGPTTGQFLYAILHAFVVGTTITVQVQSATTLGFAGPTLRATFPAITAVGGYWLARVAGPITDGFWRFNVSAITGSFTIAGSIGIGS